MTALIASFPFDAVLLIPAAVLLVGFAFMGGCRSGDSAPVGLVIVASGDTDGRIVPCGCTSNQSGGLPRRASLVEQLRTGAEVVVVDVGGAAAGTSVYERLKFEAILRGELAMGLAAHNVGASEAALGAAYLHDLARRLPLPLLSANVCDADGRSVAEPIRLVEAAGQRLALIGVLSPQYATDELTVGPPREAVLDTLEGIEGHCDVIIVLAYLPDDELRDLAQSLPEVDLVLGGPTGQPITPERCGPTLLASATGDGKFVVCLDAPSDGDARGWTGHVVELDEQYADESSQVANVRQYHAELARRDLTPEQTSVVDRLPAGLPEDYCIAGSATCLPCHVEDARIWRKSQHFAAWPSLREKGAEVDPDCQRCHVTGYGVPGGFVSIALSGSRFGVGCESCHGPSQGHVDDPEGRKTPFCGVAAGQCITCHDQENSPKFDYRTYWAKIDHGKAKAVKPAAASTSDTTGGSIP